MYGKYKIKIPPGRDFVRRKGPGLPGAFFSDFAGVGQLGKLPFGLSCVPKPSKPVQ